MTATEGDRQVFVAQPFQLRIAGPPGRRQQALDRHRPVQSAQQLAMALVYPPVEQLDVPREGGGRYPVLVVEDSAAQDVEQHIGVVMRRHGLFLGRLEPVGGRDDARQLVAARLDGLRHRLRDAGRIRQRADELHDLPLGLLDIRHDLPASGFTAGKHEAGALEIGAADPALAVFPDHGPSAAEFFELQRREQHGGSVQAEAIDDVGPERLKRLGAIRYPGVERVHGEPAARIELGPLVRVHQVAGVRLDEAGRTRGQDVLQAVDQLDRQRLVAQVLQLAAAHEAVPVARRPRVTEGERQVVIDLLKAELVAQGVLVEIAGDPETTVVFAVEGLPERLPARWADPQQGLAAGVRAAVMDLVDGDVGKQRGFRRHPASGQASGRRNEEPVIAAGNDADEERPHPVDIADDVIPLAIDVGEFARDLVRVCRGCGGGRAPRCGRPHCGPSSTSFPKRPASIQPRSFLPKGTDSEPTKFSRISLPSLSQ